MSFKSGVKCRGSDRWWERRWWLWWGDMHRIGEPGGHWTVNRMRLTEWRRELIYRFIVLPAILWGWRTCEVQCESLKYGGDWVTNSAIVTHRKILCSNTSELWQTPSRNFQHGLWLCCARCGKESSCHAVLIGPMVLYVLPPQCWTPTKNTPARGHVHNLKFFICYYCAIVIVVTVFICRKCGIKLIVSVSDNGFQHSLLHQTPPTKYIFHCHAGVSQQKLYNCDKILNTESVIDYDKKIWPKCVEMFQFKMTDKRHIGKHRFSP